MKIEKKIWSEYFEEILSGKKTFEYRLADFKCNPRDVLVLREWNPKTKKYTGRKTEKKITYVLKTKDAEKFYSRKKIDKHGFQVIGFK